MNLGVLALALGHDFLGTGLVEYLAVDVVHFNVVLNAVFGPAFNQCLDEPIRFGNEILYFVFPFDENG